MATERITEKAAAEYIGISRTHLANLRKANEGPSYFQLGKRILYTVEDVDAWLDSRKQTCGGPERTEPAAVTETVEAATQTDLF